MPEPEGPSPLSDRILSQFNSSNFIKSWSF